MVVRPLIALPLLFKSNSTITSAAQRVKRIRFKVQCKTRESIHLLAWGGIKLGPTILGHQKCTTKSKGKTRFVIRSSDLVTEPSHKTPASYLARLLPLDIKKKKFRCASFTILQFSASHEMCRALRFVGCNSCCVLRGGRVDFKSHQVRESRVHDPVSEREAHVIYHSLYVVADPCLAQYGEFTTSSFLRRPATLFRGVLYAPTPPALRRRLGPMIDSLVGLLSFSLGIMFTSLGKA